MNIEYVRERARKIVGSVEELTDAAKRAFLNVLPKDCTNQDFDEFCSIMRESGVNPLLMQEVILAAAERINKERREAGGTDSWREAFKKPGFSGEPLNNARCIQITHDKRVITMYITSNGPAAGMLYVGSTDQYTGAIARGDVTMEVMDGWEKEYQLIWI